MSTVLTYIFRLFTKYFRGDMIAGIRRDKYCRNIKIPAIVSREEHKLSTESIKVI